ncbi:MAG: hypothetical protein ACMUIP_02055 [bacterium]
MTNPLMGGVTVLYHTSGQGENGVYSRTADSSGNWMPAVRISEAPGVIAAWNQHGAVAGDGRVHAVFMGTLASWDGELFYSTQNPTDGAWSPPVQLTMNAEIFGPDMPYSWVAPVAIAIDPQDHPHIIWADYRGNNPTFYQLYHDGEDWTPETLIETPSSSPKSLYLLYDSAGIGYLLWNQPDDDSIYMMKSTGSIWSQPVLVSITSTYPDLSVTMDSQDNLHMVYNAPNGDDVSYRKYDETTWSDAEVILLDSQSFGKTPLIASTPGNGLHVLRMFSYQIYETVYNDMSWSSWNPLTSGLAARYIAFSSLDFALDSSGARLLVWEQITGSYFYYLSTTLDIIFLSSNRDPKLLPSRPIVSDDGATTGDPSSLHVSWSSSHASGIAEYEYSIGKAPGEADLRYWLPVGTDTFENFCREFWGRESII